MVENALETEVEIRLVQSVELLTVLKRLREQWCGSGIGMESVAAPTSPLVERRLVPKSLQHNRSAHVD